MKVKQLIKELRNMPQNADVGYAHFDNSEHEVSGWVHSLMMLDKSEDEPPEGISSRDLEAYESLPNVTVVLRG